MAPVKMQQSYGEKLYSQSFRETSKKNI